MGRRRSDAPTSPRRRSSAYPAGMPRPMHPVVSLFSPDFRQRTGSLTLPPRPPALPSILCLKARPSSSTSTPQCRRLSVVRRWARPSSPSNNSRPRRAQRLRRLSWHGSNRSNCSATYQRHRRRTLFSLPSSRNRLVRPGSAGRAPHARMLSRKQRAEDAAAISPPAAKTTSLKCTLAFILPMPRN